jgi:Bacterial SH3 domain
VKSFFSKSKILPIVLLTTFAVLSTFFGCPKIETNKNWALRWTGAQSGLRIREGPGLNFAPTGVIPFRSEVEIISCANDTITLDGKRGRWCQVLYQGREGYCFSGFLSAVPIASPGPRSDAHSFKQPLRKEARPLPIPPVAVPPVTAVRGNSPRELAYAFDDPPGLTKLSLKEFEAAKTSLKKNNRYSKEDFKESTGVRGETESVEMYLQRSEASKRAFLERMREAEYAAACKTFSIYDAQLVMGGYNPAMHRFAFLGTTIDLGPTGEVITLPGADQSPHGFENGRVLNVKLPDKMVKLLRENPDSVLVRLDFSYAVSLQDIFNWTSRAYFLPKYLMLYNRNTGEIYYECAASPRIEREPDPAVPLKISSYFLYEKTHWRENWASP